jgi:hypothetical protein
MRESNYWLRILKAINLNPGRIEEIEALIDESNQLKKILGSIVNKTNKVYKNQSVSNQEP